MPRRLLLLLPFALAGVACGGDADRSTSTVEARVAGPAGADGADGSWVACENTEEGYVLARPPDWHVGDAPFPCSAFDPDPNVLRDGSAGRSRAAVVIEHREEPFDTAVDRPPEGEQVVTTDEATIDSRDALRRETRAGEESRLPRGTRVTRWTVDLRAGRTLVARTTDLGDADYGGRQEVLDRIVASARWFEPGTSDEGTDPVGEPTEGPTVSDGEPRADSAPAVLADVRAEGHEGFDRVVVELDGPDVPGYRVALVDPPIRRDDSVDATPVAGEAFLEIRLAPASVLDASGSRGYEGPDRIPVADGTVVTEVVRTGGTEGPLTFTVGLGTVSSFAVGVLEGPARLVVDIVPEG
jgi:hypothetical protein